jgi:hypothetical protein
MGLTWFYHPEKVGFLWDTGLPWFNPNLPICDGLNEQEAAPEQA